MFIDMAISFLWSPREQGQSVPSASILLVSCLLLAGCSSNQESTVSGKVTLDGEPIKKASMRFFPIDGTPGPGAGSNIVDGNYEVPIEKGMLAGTYRVAITAYRKTGRKIKNVEVLEGEPASLPEEIQYISTLYNSRTELTANLVAGTNEKDFPLKSK